VKSHDTSARLHGPAAPAGLNLSGLSHSYGSQGVLSHINFSMAPGEHLALMGPSGCGKSTILRLIAGLEVLQTGSITLCGRTLATGSEARSQRSQHLPPECRGVGMVFQDHALFPHLTVMGNILFPMQRLQARDARRRAEELLNRMQLDEFSDRYPRDLSGGQRQRLALARTLAQEPGLILLDEPFSGLDPTLRKTLRKETRELIESKGIASILVTHEPAEALEYADKVLVMDHGRIEQMGTASDLMNHPRTLEIARLLWDMRPVLTEQGLSCSVQELTHVLAIDPTAFHRWSPNTPTALQPSPNTPSPHSHASGTTDSGLSGYLASSGLLPRSVAACAHLHSPIVLRCVVQQWSVWGDRTTVQLRVAGGDPVRHIRLETSLPAWLQPNPGPDGSPLQEWVLDLDRVFFFK
jgi:ABC-type Fe3+/spermidine/putrescine transport system ATPase subunit